MLHPSNEGASVRGSERSVMNSCNKRTSARESWLALVSQLRAWQNFFELSLSSRSETYYLFIFFWFPRTDSYFFLQRWPSLWTSSPSGFGSNSALQSTFIKYGYFQQSRHKLSVIGRGQYKVVWILTLSLTVLICLVLWRSKAVLLQEWKLTISFRLIRNSLIFYEWRNIYM